MISSMRKTRGVVDVVGTVLTLAVVIGTFTAAFMMGKPLVEKRMDRETIYYLQNFLTEVSEALEKVSEGGSVVIDLNMPGLKSATIEVSRDDYIQDYVVKLIIPTKIAFYAPTWVPINADSSPYMVEKKTAVLEQYSQAVCSESCESNYTAQVYLGGELKKIYVCCDEGSEAIMIDGSCAYTDGSIYQSYRIDLDCTNKKITFEGRGVYTLAPGEAGKDKPVVLIARSIEHATGVRTELRLRPRPIVIDPASGTKRLIRIYPEGYEERGVTRTSTKLPTKIRITSKGCVPGTYEGSPIEFCDIEIGFEK